MTTKDKTKEFIKLVQSLSEQEQAGVLMMIQGTRLLAQKKKQRVIRRFLP